MERYRRIMYLENMNNALDEASAQSLSVCLNKKNQILFNIIKGEIKNMEYFFCDNINNKINCKLIIQHGVKESLLLNIINKGKLRGAVGYLIVEVDKPVEKDLDKELRGYGIEKIVLN